MGEGYDFVGFLKLAASTYKSEQRGQYEGGLFGRGYYEVTDLYKRLCTYNIYDSKTSSTCNKWHRYDIIGD